MAYSYFVRVRQISILMATEMMFLSMPQIKETEIFIIIITLMTSIGMEQINGQSGLILLLNMIRLWLRNSW